MSVDGKTGKGELARIQIGLFVDQIHKHQQTDGSPFHRTSKFSCKTAKCYWKIVDVICLRNEVLGIELQQQSTSRLHSAKV
jgi:hypothetical protein